MKQYFIHIVIYIVSVMCYLFLNNINTVSPLSMCSLFIKFICCNKSLKDSDVVSDPSNVTVPFDDVQKAGEAIENVIDEVINPENKIKKMVKWWDGKKED